MNIVVKFSVKNNLVCQRVYQPLWTFIRFALNAGLEAVRLIIQYITAVC